MAIEVFLEQNPMRLSTELWILDRKADGTVLVAEPMELQFKEHERGTEWSPPTLAFYEHNGSAFLQSLANALTVAGYRPNYLKEAEGQTKAAQYHLEDMRKIALHLMKMD